MSAAASKPRDNHIVDAVRDTVTVSRKTPTRSQTAIQTVPAVSKVPPTMRQRSHSEDSVTHAAHAVERAKTKNGRPKKASQHSDVIDRLDFTGVGPMFHHDGPFDACAPSRNRHRTKAPMLAWSSAPNDPIIPSAAPNDSPYPTPDVYKNTFSNDYYDPPKKKVDAIAEAWGMHEPEPYEDFSAGGGSGRPEGDTPNSSIYNGRGGGGTKRSKDNTRDPREVYKEYLDEGQLQTQQQKEARRLKRSTLPPPQPIFIADPSHPDALESPPLLSPTLSYPKNDAPKRNKSIMQRFRKMRDSPNVPMGNYEETEQIPPSPTSAENPYSVSAPMRPANRQKDSFLGRFGGNQPKENISPTSDSFDQSKELPATPLDRNDGTTPIADQDTLGYFDERIGGSTEYSSPNGGRRTAILRRVKGVVRGSK